MAYAIFNKENSITFISKNLEHLRVRYPGYAIYQNGLAGSMVEISNENFISLQNKEKVITYDGANVTLVDHDPIIIENEGVLKINIEGICLSIERAIIGKDPNSSYVTECNTYYNLLKNLDTSSLTYPMNTSLEAYLRGQGHNVIAEAEL
jgi:hypothetical protein